MLKIEGLAKVYPQAEQAVRVFAGLSFRVAAGEQLALMGPSGEGKSTLLQLLGCLDRPSGGRYWLDGQEVSSLPEEALASVRNTKIGFVFQSSHFVDYLNLTENVALPGLYARKLSMPACQARAAELLDQLGLAHRKTHLPAALSGGERQRAAIARALFNRPGLLLADEPTGNLDAENTRQVMEKISALGRSGITVVLVTHDETVAQYADRVMDLGRGQLREREHVAL